MGSAARCEEPLCRSPPILQRAMEGSLGDYVHHVSISKGSLMELETQLLITDRLGYLSKE
jgi:four helix bundle protein